MGRRRQHAQQRWFCPPVQEAPPSGSGRSAATRAAGRGGARLTGASAPSVDNVRLFEKKRASHTESEFSKKATKDSVVRAFYTGKSMTGTPVRILMARHGETVFNIERRFQGQSDSPLTERGVAQARELAHALATEPVTAVYSSDLGRAFETAMVVAVPHGLDVIADPRLREVDVGHWSGLNGAEIDATDGERLRAWHLRPASVRLPNGEALAEVMARALDFFSERMRDHA